MYMQSIKLLQNLDKMLTKSYKKLLKNVPKFLQDFVYNIMKDNEKILYCFCLGCTKILDYNIYPFHSFHQNF